jgi:transcriptional regulator GlxA family with amidase domain
MIIGIPVYQKVDLLDVTAPHEILQWVNQYGPPLEVQIIAENEGEITTRDGFTFKAPKSFNDVAALDVLWVPGGDPDALKLLMTRPSAYLDFLVRVSKNAHFICSVCEGALLLAQAGLLDGFEATTHWAFVPCLKQFPTVKVVEGHPRFVLDGNRLTGGGISSGLDEALKLVELLTSYGVAQKVQQVVQYYPDPPVASTLPPAGACPLCDEG